MAKCVNCLLCKFELDMKIAYLNLRSARKTSSYIRNTIMKDNLDYFCATETWHCQSDEPCLIAATIHGFSYEEDYNDNEPSSPQNLRRFTVWLWGCLQLLMCAVRRSCLHQPSHCFAVLVKFATLNGPIKTVSERCHFILNFSIFVYIFVNGYGGVVVFHKQSTNSSKLNLPHYNTLQCVGVKSCTNSKKNLHWCVCIMLLKVVQPHHFSLTSQTCLYSWSNILNALL